MFVPSLSWQNDRLYDKNGIAKTAFSYLLALVVDRLVGVLFRPATTNTVLEKILSGACLGKWIFLFYLEKVRKLTECKGVVVRTPQCSPCAKHTEHLSWT